MTLLGRQPLEMLHQFRGFNDQRHRKVLGRVKLLPVALVCEFTQTFLEFAEGIHAGITLPQPVIGRIS